MKVELFCSPNCAPCKQMEDSLKKLNVEYVKHFNPIIARGGTPQLYIDGERKLVGQHTLATVRRVISKAMGKSASKN